MISSDIIRGYNDTIILSILLEKDSYGYEISKQIKLISHEKYIIKETTLYSAFNRLEKNQYIESYYGNQTQGKKRVYYKITPKGINYYNEKKEEWKVTMFVINAFIEKENNHGNN